MKKFPKLEKLKKRPFLTLKIQLWAALVISRGCPVALEQVLSFPVYIYKLPVFLLIRQAAGIETFC